MEEYALGNVKKHEGTHTGEKPFKCSKCGQGGQGALQATEKHLKVHITLHIVLKVYVFTRKGARWA